MKIYKMMTKGEMLWSFIKFSVFVTISPIPNFTHPEHHTSLLVPRMTNTNFHLTISIHKTEKGYENLQKDHLRRNALIFYQILSTIT